MAHLRVRIDLAFPMPLSGVVETRLHALRAEIKKAKKYTKKINEGLANEEVTVRAGYHICRHDEGKSCDPEIEI